MKQRGKDRAEIRTISDKLINLIMKDHPSFSECFCLEEQDTAVLGATLKIDGIIAGMAGINPNGQNTLEIGINILPTYQH